MAKNEPAPNPTPDRAELWIAEWQQKYSVAIENAREAKRTTETPGWTANYQANMKHHRMVVAAQCASITVDAKSIVESGTTEEREKSVKDAIKELADERIRHQAWLSRAVSNYRVAAENCGLMKDSIRSAARAEEERAPLVNR